MLTNYFGDMSFLGEKNEDKVYVNQDESLTDLQTLIKYSFLLNFLHESLMNLINNFTTCSCMREAALCFVYFMILKCCRHFRVT